MGTLTSKTDFKKHIQNFEIIFLQKIWDHFSKGQLYENVPGVWGLYKLRVSEKIWVKLWQDGAKDV